MNLYGFVGNDPVARVDRLGLAAAGAGYLSAVAICAADCTVVDLLGEAFDTRWDKAYLHGQIKNYCTVKLKRPSVKQLLTEITLPSEKVTKAAKCVAECLSTAGTSGAVSVGTRLENAKGTLRCDRSRKAVVFELTGEAVMYVSAGQHEVEVKRKKVKVPGSGIIAYRDCCTVCP